MLFRNDRLFEVDPWKIIEHRFSGDHSEHAESIFSLANEYMGTRGTFEEGFSGKTLEGCYIGGIFLKEKSSYFWKRRAFPTYANTMTHTTNWLRTLIEIDGERFDMSASTYSDYVRELDMKSGLMSRYLVFESRDGSKTALRWERLVSHDDPHIAALRLVVRPIDHAKRITVHFLLDGRRENTYHGNGIVHSESIRQESSPSEVSLLKRINTTGQYYMHRMLTRVDESCSCQVDYTCENKLVGCRISFQGEPGRECALDKIVSVWTSRDLGYPFGLIPKECDSTQVDPSKEENVVRLLVERSREHADTYDQVDYESVRDRHAAKIVSIWDKLDIRINGDELAQQGIRYCMFQLFNTYTGRDNHLNIGAKGLTGEWYFGRYFWDSEAYCLPHYLLTNKTAALNLLECRYNTLEAARARAREFGYDGACYAWQTIDGTEDCGVWEYVFGETHINSIVPYAIYLYTKVTGEKEYLHGKGIEVLIEESRYWATRTSWIPYRDSYGVLKCMGPDEYQQVIDNNYYTNYMARWTLIYTMRVIDEMKREVPEQLKSVCDRIGFHPDETIKWRKIADGMLLTFSDSFGIFVQDDSFLSLEPISREELDKDRDTPIEAKWTKERFQRHDLIKQPDVLLLFFLFRDDFSLDEKTSNYRFYEQRTVHGSSLSPSIHSILASEIGRCKQAYEYYLWASRLDLDDFNNNSHEGLHISSMAGTWMNIVFGFGGLVIGEDNIRLNPALPVAWKSIEFNFVYRGQTIRVNADHDKVCLCLLSGGECVPAKVYSSDVLITVDEIAVAVPGERRDRADLKAVIFDLDGVICDTAKYHYQAWKTIADELDIPFDERENERLKGVSRMQSLGIILEKRPGTCSREEMTALAEKKNSLYVRMIDDMTQNDVLPGIMDFLTELREAGIRTAICSASKNTDHTLARLGILEWFDVIVSGNDTTASKPDPQGMLLAAERLGIQPSECLVIEDAAAGIEAAVAAGMKSIGIGCKLNLHQADYVLASTKFLNLHRARMMF